MRNGIYALVVLICLIAFSKTGLGVKYEFLKDEKGREGVKKELAGLKNNVNLLVFTREKECEYCDFTKQIIQELASLSDKIKTRFIDMDKDYKTMSRYKVDKAPAIIVMNSTNDNIRFYGVPGGYEFQSLLETLKNVSSGTPGLSAMNLEKVRKITKKILIQVFVTPTCPFCPAAVVTAHKIAQANSNIRSEVIEATEFPDLSRKNNVSSVPKTVIRDDKGRKKELIGAYPLEQVVKTLLDL